MTAFRIVERPTFRIAGKKTWISGPDNEQFGRFWEESRAGGLLDRLSRARLESGWHAGPQTAAAVLGVSRVEKDPSNRQFYYMIAVEVPGDFTSAGLETYTVPSCTWAVFECHGKPPASIVEAEMFAFMQWLPSSGYRHAMAPEMEVYPANSGEDYCEFWLPVVAFPLDSRTNVP